MLDVREALSDLTTDAEIDADEVRLEPAVAVRARGDSRRRRSRLAGAAAMAAIVAGVGLGVAQLVRPPAPSPPAVAPQPQGTAIRVFLSNCASQQRLDLRQRLGRIAQIGTLDFESSQEAYERFRQLYAENPELFELTSPEALPESYRLTLAGGWDFATVKAMIETIPCVDRVFEVSR